MWKRSLVIAVLISLAGFVSAQEMVDNPEFARWSKFPKGTTVKAKFTMVVDGTTTEENASATLLDVDPEKLVLQVTAGLRIKKSEIPKTIALPEGRKKEEFVAGKPPGTFEEGTETLKLGDTEYKTMWYRYKKDASSTLETKVWVCDTVPGGVLRIESTKPKPAVTVKMEVIEFKKL